MIASSRTMDPPTPVLTTSASRSPVPTTGIRIVGAGQEEDFIEGRNMRIIKWKEWVWKKIKQDGQNTLLNNKSKQTSKILEQMSFSYESWQEILYNYL